MVTSVWFYEEHASRIFTELQAEEAACAPGNAGSSKPGEPGQ
jgi:hypothetical protein